MSYIDFIRDPARSCAIVAHRGAWHRAPENSLAAVEHAIAAGAQIAEVDVRQARDGGLFLLHDDTLERMAGIDGEPEGFTLAELNRMTLRMADGGAGKPMTDERLPSLDALLELARDRIFLDLDVKYVELMEAVAAKVKAMGMADQVDLKARVDSAEARAWLATQHGLRGVPFMAKARFGLRDGREIADAVRASGAFMCEASFERLDSLAAQAPRLAEAGISIWVNTLDPVACCDFTDSAALADGDAIWGRLLDAGVSVIQTDQPLALKAYIAARGGRG